MKSSITRLSLIAAALVIGAALFWTATLQADEFNPKTYITVNQPLQVPGRLSNRT